MRFRPAQILGASAVRHGRRDARSRRRDLVRCVVGRYRLPDALRRADALTAAGHTAAHHDRPPARLTYAAARYAAVAFVSLPDRSACCARMPLRHISAVSGRPLEGAKARYVG